MQLHLYRSREHEEWGEGAGDTADSDEARQYDADRTVLQILQWWAGSAPAGGGDRTQQEPPSLAELREYFRSLVRVASCERCV